MRPPVKWANGSYWWDDRDNEWVVGGGVRPLPGDDYSECIEPHVTCPEDEHECFGPSCVAGGCGRMLWKK
jgi:hypothetical protein